LDGTITITTKDANGNFLRTTTQDASGRLLDSTTDIRDAQGNITGSEVFHGTTIWVYDANMNLVSNPAAAITYSTPTFSESTMNNGSVRGFATISLTGDTFTGTNGQALTGAAVSNVPSGLTAVVTKASDTTATLSFTGSAASHANANDIGNLTVTLGNTAFTLGHAEVVMGATRSDLIIDFTDPPIMGGAGNDTLIGSIFTDSIIGGEGADTITGGDGQDYIDLSETAPTSDTVVINVGDSTPAGGATDLVYAFDVMSGATNDILDLPSMGIAADTVDPVAGVVVGTIAGHSIANGIISFYETGVALPVVVGDTTNWGNVKNYMMANIADGETVATYIDMDGNGLYTGAADQLAVFQGDATMDVQVYLYGTNGQVDALATLVGSVNAVTII